MSKGESYITNNTFFYSAVLVFFVFVLVVVAQDLDKSDLQIQTALGFRCPAILVSHPEPTVSQTVSYLMWVS